MDYVFYYCLLAQSLNFFTGNTGLISLVHAGFYGMGAYIYAILSVKCVPLFLAALIALALVGVASLLVSIVAFRTRDDYFVIITLSLQMLILHIFNNLSSVTNGPIGIESIPAFLIYRSPLSAMAMAVASALVTYLFLWRLTNSSWGKNLRAIRDDYVMMMSLGKPVERIKTITFVVSALIAGWVGIQFAQYVSYIDPTSFTLSESIVILSIVIIGGLGNVHGSFWSAILLVALAEVLRFVGLPGLAEGNARQIIYGALLVTIMLLRSGPAPR